VNHRSLAQGRPQETLGARGGWLGSTCPEEVSGEKLVRQSNLAVGDESPESRYEVSVERSSYRCQNPMIGIKWDEWPSNWDEQLVSGTNG